MQGKYTNYFNCDYNTHDENNNKYFPYKKIKNKMIKEKKIQRDSLSNTKNELSEKTKSDFLNKYFAANKINYFPIANNNKSNINNMSYFNRNTNLNFMKKGISSGENNSNRASSKKNLKNY